MLILPNSTVSVPLSEAIRDDRFAVDITDVIQASQRGTKVFCRLLVEQCVPQSVNAANTVDDENFVDGATRQRGKGSGSFPVATRLRLKVKKFAEVRAGTGISVAVTIAVAV